MPFRWDPVKNELLKSGRGISFEEIVLAVEEDADIDVGAFDYFPALSTIMPLNDIAR